jgi:hypothetical membrane protein
MMKLQLLFLCSLILTSFVYSTDSKSIVNNQTDKYLVPTAVGVLAVSLIAAHIVAPENYSLQKNTISDLGAQNYNKAWIMRSGFISFGALVTSAALWDLVDNRKPLICTIPVAVYGISMIATGLYSAAPFESGTNYSEREANTHSFFANLAGIALTTAILGHMITENNPTMRIVHTSGLTFVVLNSALFKIDPEHQGIYQRILWTGSLTWLSISFSF